MKKLMIAAAIVCAAALSQAATIDWSIKNLKDADGNDLSSGIVYTFCTKGDKLVKYSDFVAALTACTTAEAFNTAFAAYDANVITALSGSITTAGEFKKTGVDLATSGVPEQTKSTKLFAVILSEDPLTDSSTWYLTETTTGVPTPDASTTDVATFAITSGATPYAFNVPEPTSGLLLLLGVAGLALKRRRA